jgi:hypothetical protein
LNVRAIGHLQQATSTGAFARWELRHEFPRHIQAIDPDPMTPRIGVRVRALVDDGFITPGMTGQGTNRVPTAESARVIWDNATAYVIRLERLELVGEEQAAG